MQSMEYKTFGLVFESSWWYHTSLHSAQIFHIRWPTSNWTRILGGTNSSFKRQMEHLSNVGDIINCFSRCLFSNGSFQASLFGLCGSAKFELEKPWAIKSSFKRQMEQKSDVIGNINLVSPSHSPFTRNSEIDSTKQGTWRDWYCQGVFETNTWRDLNRCRSYKDHSYWRRSSISHQKTNFSMWEDPWSEYHLRSGNNRSRLPQRPCWCEDGKMVPRNYGTCSVVSDVSSAR